MTQLLTILLIALAVAAWIICAQARTILAQDATLDSQDALIEKQRCHIADLQTVANLQHDTLAMSEGRNAYLEWSLAHYVQALKPRDEAKLVAAWRQINWN